MTKEKKKTRVLFLFAHLHKGGMQRAVSNISMALPDIFEQHVGFFGTENPPFQYQAILHDFNVPGSLKIGLFGKILNFFNRTLKLKKFIKNQAIDVVVSFGNAANVLNAFSFNSAYRVFSVRGAIYDDGNNILIAWIYQRLIRFSFGFSDVVVAVSLDLKAVVETLTDARVLVCHIPNLFHLTEIRAQAAEPLPEHYSYLSSAPFILNVGSLVGIKGQDLLISAFAAIQKSYPDLLLVLMGRGVERNEYIRQAQILGIGASVKIIDFDSNPYRYMSRATVFVLPSRSEGFPNVLVEAMACSCPVMAFDCPTGPREILGDSEYGELVENMTAEELAKRINDLLSSDERRAFLKKQSAKRAAVYDASHVIEQWINVLSRKG